MNSKNQNQVNELKRLLVRVATTSQVSFTTFNFRCNVILQILNENQAENQDLINEVNSLKKLAESLEEKLSMPRGKRSFAKAGNVVDTMKHRGIQISEELEEEILNNAKQNQPE